MLFRFAFSSVRAFVILFLRPQLSYAKPTMIRSNNIVECAPKPRAGSRLHFTDERNAMDKGIHAMSENTAASGHAHNTDGTYVSLEKPWRDGELNATP